MITQLDNRVGQIPAMSHRAQRFLPRLHRADNLVALLRDRASTVGYKQAFRFLRGDGVEEASLTYRGLHESAMAIAGELQAMAPPGDRALLLFPPGLDFITAFFGCLYAGIIAVPAAVPGRNRMTSSVDAIFDAAQPSLVLSTAEHSEQARHSYACQSRLLERPWVAVDLVEADRQHAWHDLEVTGEQTAFLQYTSGSTSIPKGVVISHRNLLCNASLTQEAFGTTPESSAVFWLPLHHDMGLIGGVIQPIYCGGSCTLLAPAAFLQRPALWLETISEARATISGGPDFAYDLCVRKVTASERAELDLSCWQTAFLGAERIRPRTLEQFDKVFAPCGFRRQAFFPCYGLAEATLMVTGGPRRSPPVVVRLMAEALSRNQVEVVSHNGEATRALVACGEGLPGQRILIVDPETHLAASRGEIGEIWLQGPSMASGYYQSPEATASAFRAYLADTGAGPFLRTGDLGFFHDGQLFVTGRLKSLIIIRGRNHYAEDIEATVDGAYQGIRASCCAAFSVEMEDQDRLVVVQEVEPRRRDLDTAAVIEAIRAAIAARHEVEVHAIVLAKAGTVPKTSSGKIRRSVCRDRYLRGQLETIAVWNARRDDGEDGVADESPAAMPHKVTAREIESWLIQRITQRLRLDPSDVDVTTPFLALGLGSLDAVEIAAGLERWLGRHLSPIAIYNYPTIASLAQWLASPPAVGDFDAAPPSLPSLPADLNPQRLAAEVCSMSDEEMQAFIAREMAKQEGK